MSIVNAGGDNTTISLLSPSDEGGVPGHCVESPLSFWDSRPDSGSPSQNKVASSSSASTYQSK